MSLLETVEIETGPEPRSAVIWLHGLGADGHAGGEFLRRHVLRGVVAAVGDQDQARQVDPLSQDLLDGGLGRVAQGGGLAGGLRQGGDFGAGDAYR